ncbi:MAG TPA: hypothetical protein VN776_00130 [Terracidiphilus sp.]|nr:hypothetical protein [Terracidiphilus sp.]
MDLLDRYLEAVKKHLPWQRQDDIVAELRANLESQLEEKESELGRPLTAQEAEDWLKQLGSPLQMAAPYQPQQYLIGPAVFPIYRTVLKIAFTWAIVIYSIVTAVLLLAGTPSWTALLEAVLRVPVILMTTAAWVTLVFAVLEYAVTRNYIKFPAMVAPAAGWSPGALPPLGHEAAQGKKPRSFAQAVAEVIFGFLFLVWLLLVPEHPWLIMGPGAFYLDVSPFQLAAVWVQFYWCVIAFNILQLGWNAENLWRGRWQKPQPIKRMVLGAVGLIPLAMLLTARDHATVLLKHPMLDQARYGATLDTINKSVNWSVALICAITVVQLLWGITQMILNAYRKRAAAIR